MYGFDGWAAMARVNVQRVERNIASISYVPSLLLLFFMLLTVRADAFGAGKSRREHQRWLKRITIWILQTRWEDESVLNFRKPMDLSLELGIKQCAEYHFWLWPIWKLTVPLVTAPIITMKEPKWIVTARTHTHIHTLAHMHRCTNETTK